MKRAREANGDDWSFQSDKRTRGDLQLHNEFQRRISRLNQAFLSWIESNFKGNPLAVWQDGCQDYITYAKQLQERFCLTGSILSFGSGDCGQLGHGVEEDADLSVTRPRVVDSIQDTKFHYISAGGLHNLAIAENGRVWSWGCADNEVLGRPGDENYAALVRGLNNVRIVQVSAGDCHSTALGIDGNLFVWGTYLDKDGRKWFDTGSDGAAAFQVCQKEPKLVEALVSKHGGVTQVASGANHTIALCADGHVYSWGIGDTGQLGRKVCELKDDQGLYRKDLIRKEHLIPATMKYKEDYSSVDNARFIACGSYHTFVISAFRSRVYGTGLNQYAQLGVKVTKEPVEALVPVTSLEGKGIASVCAGEHFSLALSAQGELYSFGRCDQNQLGIELNEKDTGAGAFLDTPQLVGGPFEGKEVVKVSAGSTHTIAITSDNMAYTWGFGEMNQLGHGREADEKLPTLINRFHKKSDRYDPCNVSLASAGGQHTLIVCPRKNDK